MEHDRLGSGINLGDEYIRGIIIFFPQKSV